MRMALTLDELVLQNSDEHLNNKAVVYDNGKDRFHMTYRRLLDLCSQLKAYFSDKFTPGEVIGLCLKSDQYIPVILLSVLRCGTAFYNMDSEAAEFSSQVLQEIGARFVIVHKDFLQILKEKLLLRGTLIQLSIPCLDSYVMVKCESAESSPQKPGLAYCITTSGTTGRPKVVKVPHSCIVPNITQLRETFSISPDDLVLMASPLTFDPSLVEIFMTLTSGACLLIVPESLKMMPDLLLSTVHLRNTVTVMQLTPTLLLRFDADGLSTTLLGDNSDLRVMALGGEQFPPLSFIQKIKSLGNRTRLFNLYGTTEVSCWATCYEMTEEDLRSKDHIPIGPCMQETSLEVRDSDGKIVTVGVGELYIGGSLRQCSIGLEEQLCNCDENGLIMRATGDIVEIMADGQIYYHGRRDRQIKRHGKRINLEEIELVASQLDVVHQCEVLLLDNRLILFAVKAVSVQSLANMDTDISDVIKKGIVKDLPSHSVPEDVIVVDNLPVTKHGKVDMNQLRDIYAQERSVPCSVSPAEFLAQRWNKILGLESPIIESANFISQGGSSLKALLLLNELENILNRNLAELMDIILQKTYRDIKYYISQKQTDVPNKLQAKLNEGEMKNEGFEDGIEKPSNVCKRKIAFEKHERQKLLKPDFTFFTSVNRGSKFIKMKGTNDEHLVGYAGVINECVCLENSISDEQRTCVQMTEKWRYDTEKCVDASPLIAISRSSLDDDVVFIGSHSHKMCAIKLSNGKLKWEITLPDRIESSACLSLCGNFVIVGCYDGRVYCIRSNNGDIWWSYDTGADVKSTPAVDRVTGLVYVGSHSQTLYCFDVMKRRVRWEKCLQSGSISSSPALWYDPHYVCTGTLGGSVFAVSTDSGEVLWKACLGKPVFSSLSLCQDGVCFGCTDNRLYFLSHSGQQIWSFPTNGPIFSSPVIFFLRRLPTETTTSSKHFDQDQECKNPEADIINYSKDQFIICGCHDKFVYCITTQGSLVWKVLIDSSVYATPFVGSVLLDTTERLFTNVGMYVQERHQLNKTENFPGHGISEGKIHETYTHDHSTDISQATEPSSCISFQEDKNNFCHHGFKFGDADNREMIDLGEECLSDRRNNTEVVSTRDNVLSVQTHYSDWNRIQINNVRTKSDNIIGIEINSKVPSMKVRLPIVVVTSSKGKLYLMHASTGKILCTRDLPHEVYSSPVMYDNTIVVGCRDDYVYCFKVNTE